MVRICTSHIKRILKISNYSNYAKNCRENTAGDHCDLCATGYYGDPSTPAGCLPCQCPTAEKNFARTCSVSTTSAGRHFNCQCREGYTGPKCDRCADGFYGSPLSDGGECLPCACNAYGSVSEQCDEISGQCECVAGVAGRDCSQCHWRHVLTPEKRCKDCGGVCSGNLLNRVHGDISKSRDRLHLILSD